MKKLIDWWKYDLGDETKAGIGFVIVILVVYLLNEWATKNL